MRRARPLFLLAIVGIFSYLGYTYRLRLEELRKNAPDPPAKLPATIGAELEDWHWEKSAGNGPAVNVRAKNMRHNQEKNLFELEHMDLKIFHKDGKTFDHVLSDRADFNLRDSQLFVDGDATITLGLAEGQEPKPGRIIHIKASGVKLDAKAGKAETDRAVEFAFDRGDGKATGAVYDSGTRELQLKSNASLVWKDNGPVPRPMKVEAGQITYKETESKVYLTPWSKFARGTMTLEGAAATVTLDPHGVRLVETTGAKGGQNDPARQLEYAADQLVMNLSEKSEVEKIHGEGNARLIASSAKGITEARTRTVDLEFDASQGDSILKRALATGQSVVESKPVPGNDRAETRVLRSEVIEVRMREGGKEIAALDTQSPGVLEFLPNRPGQRKRRVEGDRFHVAYGSENRLESFRTSQASTRTENEPRKGKPQPPALTWSKEMEARFAPESGEMTRLEQWGDFRYEEGERKARAGRGILDQGANEITLVDAARVSDNTGSTAADRIYLDQKTEDFRAEGNVSSSRLPDRKGGGAAMLAKDEALQARAQKMTTTGGRALVVYEGGAVLWQGSSRLEADRIEIDRANSVLKADGKVSSQLLEKAKAADARKAPAAPVFTVIRAPSMVYYDKERLAHYTGGVTLKRAALDVTAREIRAYLKESKDNDSSLDKAVADGAVVIVSVAADRTRRGRSEHAEYYAEEGKVLLEQGQPSLEDNVRGDTRGNQLIYYANDDRLLVNGVPSQPAVSKVRRKH